MSTSSATLGFLGSTHAPSETPTFSYKVFNVACSFDLHRRVDTIQLYEEWRDGRAFKNYDIVIYDDETVFGWLDISPKGQKKPKLRLYPSGKGYVLGAKSVDEAVAFIASVQKELENI